MDAKVIRRLEEIVGKEKVLTSIENRIAYSYDATPALAGLPDAIVIPETPEHVSQILKLANEEKFIVVPRGSGTGLSGGSVPSSNSIVLLMNRWRKILEIDKENLTALVEPGVITAQLHQEVEKYGLFYPPDPGSMTISTIGGNVAENAGGLRGLKYGVTKNYVLGLEVVLPTGEIINIGGKNVKDVAGYNLKDVLIGSEGTLGVFTKILLKLIPKPQSSRTLLAFFNSIKEAGKTVADIIASHITPATLEFLDNTTIRCVEDYARLGLPTNAGALLLIEVDGHPAQVEEESEKIEKICVKNGATDYKIAKSENEALKLKTARRSAFAALARVKPTTILEDATVPRSFVPEMVEKIQEIANKHQIIIGNFGHAGDGNLHPTALTDERDKEEMKKVEMAFEEIFDYAIKLGGTITGEHGVGLAKKKFLEKQFAEPAIEFMRNIKRVLDPNGILNTGKIFELKPRCEGRLPSSREQIEKYANLWT
ncbi:MAG: glycolate oxidase subunit GlcD [Candidatus Kryptonium sp.]|nr:glycolate oxidase subunit GlcD [Candidatus Kryptonium sp.]MCX7762528.1 glycolate oxidase subunit GlcD [Candidatus Kryptonium sp.]MDW8108230.1 glycolate oxidase subunit GlcD [Candidatus Kryptonium sp.]